MVLIELGLRVLYTASTIEEPVSGLDGVVDSAGSVISDLPETEPHLRHLLAGGLEGDSRSRNHLELRGGERLNEAFGYWRCYAVFTKQCQYT